MFRIQVSPSPIIKLSQKNKKKFRGAMFLVLHVDVALYHPAWPLARHRYWKKIIYDTSLKVGPSPSTYRSTREVLLCLKKKKKMVLAFLSSWVFLYWSTLSLLRPLDFFDCDLVEKKLKYAFKNSKRKKPLLKMTLN